MQGLIGAASGIISNGLSNIVTNRSFFDGAAKAAAWGVVSAYASYGVGEIFKYAPSTVGKEIVQGVTHAFVHGNISQLQGGSFLSGATSGLLSSGISSGITGFGGGDIEQILGGGLGGGIGSAINGDNFWRGFGIGISVGAFNHALHKGLNGGGDPPKKSATRENLGSLNDVLGIQADAAELIGGMKVKGRFEKYEDLLRSQRIGRKIKSIGKLVGKATGVLGVLDSGYEVYKNPSDIGAWAKFGVNTAALAAGPTAGLVIGFADITGLSDLGYNYIRKL